MLWVLRGTTSILVAWVPHTEGFTSRKHNWTLGLLIFSVTAKIHLQRSPIFFWGEHINEIAHSSSASLQI